jgi:hypothetical protein
VTRLELARAEIARRRAQAEAATAGPWESFFGKVQADGDLVAAVALTYANATFIATNDPAHVLLVLAAADALLDRHAPRTEAPWPGMCATCLEPGVGDPDPVPMPWPCPDAQAVLDLYAPQETT